MSVTGWRWASWCTCWPTAPRCCRGERRSRVACQRVTAPPDMDDVRAGPGSGTPHVMGVQLGFMGVQLGGKGHRGRIAGGAGTAAAAGGCRRAFLGREPRDAAAAVRPRHGAPPRPRRPRRFRRSQDRTGQPAGAAAFPCPGRCRPGRPLAVLAWSGDGSPIRGCTTTSGDRVPRTR